MKAIMISIKPKWCAKIMNGDKTVEVRKNKALASAIRKLIDEYGYADIYGYCTKEKPYLINKLSRDLAFWQERDLCAEDTLNGKVIFKFRCYKVEEILPFIVKETKLGLAYELTKEKIINCQRAQLTYDEYNHYLKGKKGYAIHISDLEIFDKPKELSEFHNAFKYKRFERKFGNNNIEKDERTGGMRQPVKGGYEYVYPLTKAPQNFCYVEE